LDKLYDPEKQKSSQIIHDRSAKTPQAPRRPEILILEIEKVGIIFAQI
jgi:hypothetical protein